MHPLVVNRGPWRTILHSLLLRAIAVVALCALLPVFARAQAEPLRIGLHATSWHLGADHMQTPGLYVRWGSWAAGGYRNSIGRTSYYATRAWQFGLVEVAAGIVTGYGYRVRRGYPCRDAALTAGWTTEAADHAQAMRGSTCRVASGEGPAVSPLLALSTALPAVGDVTPRVTFVPAAAGVGRSHVLHLSIERSF